jgi:hypothetical protein
MSGGSRRNDEYQWTGPKQLSHSEEEEYVQTYVGAHIVLHGLYQRLAEV